MTPDRFDIEIYVDWHMFAKLGTIKHFTPQNCFTKTVIIFFPMVNLGTSHNAYNERWKKITSHCNTETSKWTIVILLTCQQWIISAYYLKTYCNLFEYHCTNKPSHIISYHIHSLCHICSMVGLYAVLNINISINTNLYNATIFPVFLRQAA